MVVQLKRKLLRNTFVWLSTRVTSHKYNVIIMIFIHCEHMLIWLFSGEIRGCSTPLFKSDLPLLKFTSINILRDTLLFNINIVSFCLFLHCGTNYQHIFRLSHKYLYTIIIIIIIQFYF